MPVSLEHRRRMLAHLTRLERDQPKQSAASAAEDGETASVGHRNLVGVCRTLSARSRPAKRTANV
jgi:hypothetical protein